MTSGWKRSGMTTYQRDFSESQQHFQLSFLLYTGFSVDSGSDVDLSVTKSTVAALAINPADRK